MPIQILQPFNPLWQVGGGGRIFVACKKGSSYRGNETFELFQLYPFAVLEVDGCSISHQSK